MKYITNIFTLYPHTLPKSLDNFDREGENTPNLHSYKPTLIQRDWFILVEYKSDV